MRILDAFGLAKYFPRIVGGDGPWPRKPAPEGMQFLMRDAAARAEDTVLIGDSSIDLHTSRNAGVHLPCAVWIGFADVPAGDLRGDESLVDAPGEISKVLHARRWQRMVRRRGFPQVVVDRLRTIDQVASIKVQDAPATRSEADYNFIANEIFVTFATRIEHEPIKRLGVVATRPVAVTVMTFGAFAKMLEESDGIGPADYADEGVIQYLRTERIIPPYQTKGYKLVELVRICEAK